MDIFEMPKATLSYPVGDNIPAALQFATNAAEIFNKVVQDQVVNIWCRGSSGAILAAFFSSKLTASRSKVVHIKKKGEWSHGWNNPYYNEPAANVIIDDFIGSGETLNAIYSEMVDANRIYVPDVLIISNYKHRHELIRFKPNILITCK